MTGIDRRTALDRDAELLAQINREGGFSVLWLTANRDRAASFHRLVQSGRIRIAGAGWIKTEATGSRLAEWWALVKFALGGQSV